MSLGVVELDSFETFLDFTDLSVADSSLCLDIFCTVFFFSFLLPFTRRPMSSLFSSYWSCLETVSDHAASLEFVYIVVTCGSHANNVFKCVQVYVCVCVCVYVYKCGCKCGQVGAAGSR